MSLGATMPRSSRRTPQRTQLEALKQRYSGRGFTVIGFPCTESGAPEPGTAEDIAWNFERFVVSPRGAVVARFRSKVARDAPRVVAAIEAQLPPE
jgi:glutathione peroxidase